MGQIMSRTRHHGRKAKQRAFGRAWRWLSQTPGWWIKMMMTRPQRRKVKLWERDVQKRTDFENVPRPPHGRKPHHYYW